MTGILWLASYPKSGNTWVRLFLLNLFTNSREPLPPSEVSRMSTSDAVMAWYRRHDARPPAEWSLADVARLRLAVQRELAAGSQDTLVVKTHSALVPIAGRAPFDMSVASGAIYIVRNPLDIVASYARHLGQTPAAIVEIMSTPGYMAPRGEAVVEIVQGGWSQHVASWTGQPNPRLHVVRYEDLVADPSAGFAAIARFLGLDPPAERLERAIAHAALPTLRRLEDEHGFNERTRHQDRFFGEGTVGGWRETLPDGLARRLVARHRVQMARFGYLPEGM